MKRYCTISLPLKWYIIMVFAGYRFLFFIELVLYLINFVVNSHVWDTGQSLINDNFTVVSIVKSTFKE